MKVGVIGTGVMGKNHVRVYNSLKDRCQLVGVYDIDYRRARQVAEEYGIVAFKKLDDLLKQVDAVSIAVPTEAHFDVGLKCLDHQIHVLIEKPITQTTAQAEQLIQKANNAGVKLQVGHIELFNPTINVLRNILSDEDIVAFDIHRMSPLESRIVNVNVVKDLMIHDIYILFYLLEDQVDQVYAMGRTYNDTVKHAITLFRFKNGVVAQLTASQMTEEKVRTIRVVTKKAFIQADLLDKKIVISRSTNFYMEKAIASYTQQNIMEKIVVPVQEPLKIQLIHFIDSIEKNTKPRVSGEDGLTALSTAEKINLILLNS